MKRTDKATELQRRRRKAGRLLLKGVTQAEVARRVGVSRATVSDWNRRIEHGGIASLNNRVRGRPARLDAAKRAQLAEALLAGARSHGYATELWTLPRIAKLIEERFGFSYSTSQISRLLTAMAGVANDPKSAHSNATRRSFAHWKN